MDKEHRESSTNLEGSEKKLSFVINATEDRVSRLRQAYLDGTLIVDSERLAEKMLAFEQQLEIVFPEKDSP
ncbi:MULTISPECIES: flagellar biosynthesis anti-sigma factor FlgM [Gammaproteobacteria]|uniref:flagellar biosynthesis anti-sigma factor FlgM n=1 Tax=Gammaproteobacteria TaxID=1236 RepID=UPI000C789A6B|nr:MULTISPECIES: flagellar biosynthesis anti-sigma factor FlgM [Gammaproteobacteria]MBO9483234.1 flagellar biosynthesis anti-sigma factor FlgM [Salinisphaera sp. G21_0]WBA79932.1 flagellar biosynthesis anti-sigma factor FlgM [Endozoicomonas sp. GU-1]WBA87508.1 flagellar biosynthesis anti-sigma factor FlgM [Endozoicomonas sp. GU-1]